MNDVVLRRYTQPCLQLQQEQGFVKTVEVPLLLDPTGKYMLVSDFEDTAAINKTLHSTVERLNDVGERRLSELTNVSREFDELNGEYKALKNHAAKLYEVLILAETWVDKQSPTKKFIDNALAAYKSKEWK